MTAVRRVLWLLGNFGALACVALSWWQVFEDDHSNSETAFLVASCVVSPLALIIMMLAFTFDQTEPNVPERVAFMFWIGFAFTVFGIFAMSRHIVAIMCCLWIVYATMAVILAAT